MTRDACYLFTVDLRYARIVSRVLRDLVRRTSLDIFVYTQNPLLVGWILRWHGLRDVKVRRVRLPAIHQFPVSMHASLANYFRLFAIEDLERVYKRILYLDSDIRICADLSPLLEYDLEGRTLGMVAHLSQDEERRQTLSVPCYYNSGVLLVDKERWHASRCLSRLLDFIAKEPGKIKFWDQDALNAVLQDEIHPLPPEYNLTADQFHRTELVGAAKILHFTGTLKPWLRGTPSTITGLYYVEKRQ